MGGKGKDKLMEATSKYGVRGWSEEEKTSAKKTEGHVRKGLHGQSALGNMIIQALKN